MRFITIGLLLICLTACTRLNEQSEVSRPTETTATSTAPSAGVSAQETAEVAQILILEQTREAEFQAQIDGLDSFSRDLINLMLDSHNRWQTLQAEVKGTWRAGEQQTLQHNILIRQPYLARVSGSDYQAILGQDEATQQRIDHEMQLLPGTIEAVQPLTIYLHPLSGLGLGFAGENIFPTGLAQRGGRLELIAEENILERPTWVVDWYAFYDASERRNRYWIDQETGIILKSWGYAGDEIYEEIEFTALVLDEPIADEAFFEEGRTVNGREGMPVEQPILLLADYPPSKSPYYIEDGDLWLVHTPEGRLYAFAPVAPTYADEIDVDECRTTWSEPQDRFIDPCSGDEWELNGALNLEHSTELWSNRDLDQYGLSIEEGRIFVHLNNVVAGLPLDQPPLAQDSQYGVTVTAVSADFTPKTTTIDTMIQVDPIWQMDPAAFPPQQALSYPDVLLDDQGRTVSGEGREGGTAVYNPSSGGLQQMMFNRWEAVAPEATVVTATLSVDLSNLNHEVTLPLEWESHQAGDTWDVNLPLGIGYADVRVRQIEWVATADNGLARLRLTISDDSPDDLRLNCLEVGTAVAATPACATFDDEQTYTILTTPREPVTLQLRAGVQLTPFQLPIPVTHSGEKAVLPETVPAPTGLLYRLPDEGIWLISQTGEPQQLTTVTDALPSPNAAHAVYAKEGDLWLIDLANGRERQLTKNVFLTGDFVWRWRDAHTLLVGIWNDLEKEAGPNAGHLAQIDIGSGELTPLDPDHLMSGPPAVAPDGQTIAYNTIQAFQGDRDLSWIYHPQTGPLLFDPTTFAGTSGSHLPRTGMISPAWSADGRYLAWLLSHEGLSRVGVFDLQAQTVIELPAFEMVNFGGPYPASVFSPDGQHLVLHQLVPYPERNGLWLYTLDNSPPILIAEQARDPVWINAHVLLFSNYGVGFKDQIHQYDLQTGQRKAVTLPAGARLLHIITES